MAKVEKSVLVHFSADKMFNLVHNVVDYPEFLPWCGGSAVEELEPHVERASVEIAFKSVKQSFTTINRIEQGRAIHMTLDQGPFRNLRGEWAFIPLSDEACKITFELDYEFSSKVLEQLVGPVFHSIANSFVDSFIKRAESLHADGQM